MSEAVKQLQEIEPVAEDLEKQRYSMADIARACWNEAVRAYETQMMLVASGNLKAPDPTITKQAFTLAAGAKLFDVIALDPKGFLTAWKRVKEGGKFK